MTMSLGLLGDYGSGSEISDSDGEFEQASSDKNNKKNLAKCDNDAIRSRTEPLAKVGSGGNEGETPKKEGDPLSYIQDNSSSSDDNSDSINEDTPSDEKDTPVPLPLPDLDQLTSPTGHGTISFSSVFSNPYKEAEEAKLSMLKRHVSDFALDEKPSSRERTKHHKYRGGRGNKRTPRHGLASDATPTDDTERGPQRLFNDDDSCAVMNEVTHRGKRKQRSGVSSSLVPPKKYLKSYGKAQVEERPWTVRTLSQK